MTPAASLAIALFLTGATACTLSQSGRDRCRSDGDCNAGRVCQMGACVAPGHGGASGTGGSTSDAGDTGGGPCDPSQPFGEPKLVPGLNMTGANECARFSPDERTVYLSMFRGTQRDLGTASRGSVAEPFGPITLLDALNTGYHEACPFVTENGLSLYFETNRAGTYQIFVSTRAQQSDAFPAPEPAAGLNAGFEGGVYFASGNDIAYFHSIRTVSNSSLYRGERTGAGFTITPLVGVNSTLDEYNPVPAADELSVYFGLARSRQATDP